MIKVTHLIVLFSCILSLSVQAAPFVYVVDRDSTSVIPIDVATYVQGTPIFLGGDPYFIAITPDGSKAYVTNFGTQQLHPINLTTNTAETAIALGATPVLGTALAITTDGSKAYVLTSTSLIPVTLATREVGTPIPLTGTFPISVAVNPAGTMAYVVNTDDNNVTPVNLITGTTGTVIPVGIQPSDIAITPDGTKAYVVNTDDDTVTPIDLTTSTPTPGTDIEVGDTPSDVAISPDGTKAYVTNTMAGTVSVINTKTDMVEATIQTNAGAGLIPIVITSDGTKAYAANYSTGVVVELNLITAQLARTLNVGGSLYSLAVTPSNSYTQTSNIWLNKTEYLVTFPGAAVTGVPIIGYRLYNNGSLIATSPVINPVRFALNAPLVKPIDFTVRAVKPNGANL